jgi:hypothetical protein
LGNIRDMHRLLSFKGYRFRDIHRSAPPGPTNTSVLASVRFTSRHRHIPTLTVPFRTSSRRRN